MEAFWDTMLWSIGVVATHHGVVVLDVDRGDGDLGALDDQYPPPTEDV